MGTDPCPPWVRWQSLPWQSVNSNCSINLQNSVLPNAQPIAAFPSYANRFGFGVSAEAPPAVAASRFLQRCSVTPPPLDPMNAPPEAAVAERRFLVFDQSGDRTSILLSSIGTPLWNLNHRSPKPKPFDKCGMRVGGMPGNYVPVNLSDGTEVSDGGEMREDTDEIDALLYSDSEFEEDASGGEEDEEASTGQFPEGPTASVEEVASNSVPTKRRRLTEEEAIDASLVDTASSARARELCAGTRYEDDVGNKGDDDDVESSCVGGGPVGGAREELEPPRTGASKGLKRARVQETLCVLRKIIPGGKGKDDAAVLDQAIRYLRSLKLKAKALGHKLK